MIEDLTLARGPAAGFAAVGVLWGGFAGLVPALKPQAGLSDGAFGVAMVIAACGAVLAMWLAPRADAALGRRALPVLGVAMAASFLAPGLATTGAGFAVALALGSVTSGTLDVVVNARVSVLEGAAGRPLMNLCHGLYSVGYAVAAIAAGLLREAGLGPSGIFAVLCVAVLVLCVPMGTAPVGDLEPSADAPPTVAPGWALLGPGGLIVLVAFMAEQGTEGWSALHLERNLGAGAAASALGPAILGLTMAAGRFSGQALAHRLSEASVLQAGAAVSAAGALVAAWSPHLWLAYAGFAALGIEMSVMAPTAFAWVGRLVPGPRKALAISRIAVLGYAGFFVGPPVMGFLSEGFGLPAAFTFVAATMVLIPTILVPLMLRRERAATA